jgi:hypothetical protein
MPIAARSASTFRDGADPRQQIGTDDVAEQSECIRLVIPDDSGPPRTATGAERSPRRRSWSPEPAQADNGPRDRRQTRTESAHVVVMSHPVLPPERRQRPLGPALLVPGETDVEKFCSRARLLLAGEVGKWLGTAGQVAEPGQEALLIVASRLFPGDRVPGDQGYRGVWELPDVSASPMADRRASTELGEVGESAAGDIGLPDVDDVSTGNPLRRRPLMTRTIRRASRRLSARVLRRPLAVPASGPDADIADSRATWIAERQRLTVSLAAEASRLRWNAVREQLNSGAVLLTRFQGMTGELKQVAPGELTLPAGWDNTVAEVAAFVVKCVSGLQTKTRS